MNTKNSPAPQTPHSPAAPVRPGGNKFRISKSNDSIVLVEAEGFADFGGWVLDQQFMDQMGSPYLLAHGLGVPVADAQTRVKLPTPGAYRVWVRTKDWVAPWQAPGAPGRFQVVIDGQPLAAIFGTQGELWHWQDGGMVRINRTTVDIALHDLAGCEGRCDAILFCADISYVPPHDGANLNTCRRSWLGLPNKPESAGVFDLVVVGGGIAGLCAAITAARCGLTVALVQDRPVVGGNNSSEVRVWLGGDTNLEPYPRIGNLVRELEPAARAHTGPENTSELYEDQKRLSKLATEKNLTPFLNYRVVAIKKDGPTISTVTAQNIQSGRQIAIQGSFFADCTGDGAVGFLAGADYDVTRKLHMGPTNLWNVADTGLPAPFPPCPWALDLKDKPFPGRGQYVNYQGQQPGLSNLGQWFWESGCNAEPVADDEMTRDWNLRAMYGAWDALKNVERLYPTHKLNWAAYVAGKRESRRLLGDVVLTDQDVRSGRKFDDACFPCTWALDLHYPHPDFCAGFKGREFITYAAWGEFKGPYWAPYRCLYSRNIANLFMAGRDISVTHEALGTVRVMRTCGMMGEVVGLAAGLAAAHRTTPRGVYQDHLTQLQELMIKGVPA